MLPFCTKKNSVHWTSTVSSTQDAIRYRTLFCTDHNAGLYWEWEAFFCTRIAQVMLSYFEYSLYMYFTRVLHDQLLPLCTLCLALGCFILGCSLLHKIVARVADILHKLHKGCTSNCSSMHALASPLQSLGTVSDYN